MARITTRKGPSHRLSYEQRKVKSKTAKENRQKQKDDVNDILDMVDMEINRLAITHRKPIAYFKEQVHQGGRFARQKRLPNIYNAAQHAIVVVEKDDENLDISPEEHAELTRVVEKFNTLGGPEFAKDLNKEDHKVLTDRLDSTRRHIHTAPHARPIGVLHDSHHVLKNVEGELHHLNARTETEAFLFTVKGKDEHHQDGSVMMTPKAESFLVNILKLDPDKVSREFEAYVLRNAEGIVLNHNERVGELRLKIRQLVRTGLAAVAGVEIEMEYVQFERLVVEPYGIDIVGWPTGVLFANPSKITRVVELNRLHAALSEGTCHWVRFSAEEKEAHIAENVRRMAAGEDPYAPRGGEKAKTASKKRKASDDAAGSSSAKKTKAAKEKEKGTGKMKAKAKAKGKGKGKGKAKKSSATVAAEDDEQATDSDGTTST